ncbi:general secretion pathway protein C [Bordetella ansorpii]|uniref:General secretion pathway protein C n=1 Tax=Bordetella ansorpii TaxID=288768 RepID=A0A157QMQ0_9BORD|nr:type II secretion system protein N [Bordetella ansorpii]SAI47162.1 general secretion pathway protein C [Bordetella ansorpii]
MESRIDALKAHLRPNVVGALGGVVAVAGLLYWGVMMWQPADSTPPSAAAQTQPLDVVATAATWFTPEPTDVQVTMTGLLRSNTRASAMLSVNGRPSQAYVVGERVARGVVIKHIEANRVVLEQGDRTMVVELPAPEDVGQAHITRTQPRS